VLYDLNKHDAPTEFVLVSITGRANTSSLWSFVRLNMASGHITSTGGVKYLILQKCQGKRKASFWTMSTITRHSSCKTAYKPPARPPCPSPFIFLRRATLQAVTQADEAELNQDMIRRA
jgi:hypothetical protein